MTDDDAVLKLVSTGYSLLAEDLYELVQQRGDLPSPNDILKLLHGREDFEQAGNAINSLFIDLAKKAFLNAFYPEHRGKAEPLLTVSKELCEDSKNDSCSFQFLGQILDKFDKGSIDAFFNTLKRYQDDFIQNDIQGKHTIAFSVPNGFIKALLKHEDIKPFLYQCMNANGTEQGGFYILNIGEIRSFFVTNQLKTDFYSRIDKCIQHFNDWSLTTDLEEYKVDYLVLNVTSE